MPTARELALNDAGRALIEFAEAPLLTMARPFAAPPGVPADRAKALQAAFVAAHRDPQFLAEAEKLGVDISPVGADGHDARHREDGAGVARRVRLHERLFAGHKGG